jgi:hypothetical protein
MSDTRLPFMILHACTLNKLDLQFMFVSIENHFKLLHPCTNLEFLEVCF